MAQSGLELLACTFGPSWAPIKPIHPYIRHAQYRWQRNPSGALRAEPLMCVDNVPLITMHGRVHLPFQNLQRAPLLIVSTRSATVLWGRHVLLRLHARTHHCSRLFGHDNGHARRQEAVGGRSYFTSSSGVRTIPTSKFRGRTKRSYVLHGGISRQA
jgi:hypothetical protein